MESVLIRKFGYVALAITASTLWMYIFMLFMQYVISN